MTPRTQLAVVAALATALTASSLSAVYVDGGWHWPVLGSIIAALIGAEVGSRIGARLLLPAFWRATGGVAGVLMFACAKYAPHESWLGFGPTPGAITRLRELTSQAFDDIHSLAAPVPTHEGLILVTMVGVGLVAVVVDLLSVRAALTGLPLLALYSVPEWLSPHGTGALPFLAAAAGYLVLLVREGRERTTRWGRTINSPADSPIAGSEPSAAGAISQVGRRIGVAALGAALVVPPLLPGLDHAHLLGFGSGPGNGKHGPVITYNPIARIAGLLNESTPVPQLRYSVSRGPATGGLYLKWTTLDRFDSLGWSQSDLNPAGQANATLPEPDVQQFQVTAQSVTTQVHVDDALGLKWLPVPPDTTSVTGLSDQWVYDAPSRTIFSPHSNTRDLTYSATSLAPTPSASSLLASEAVSRTTVSGTIAHYLDMPRGMSPEVRRTAIDLTKRYKTPYQKALALQDFFTTSGGFVYDTNAQAGNSTDLLANFVLHTKRGFCEQFAAAMGIMARMVGIPSRVAVGFTPGIPDGNGNERLVTTADAHAWPELYFENVGWLRFEPTPRDDGRATPPAYATKTPDEVKVNTARDTGSSPPTTRDRTGSSARSKLPPNIDFNGDPLRRLPVAPLQQQHHISARTLAVIALVAALLVLLAAVPIGRVAGRRRRHARANDPVSAAHAAWDDVVTDGEDLGFMTSASDSPRAAARRLVTQAGLGGDAAAALGRLARVEERARYAKALPDAGDVVTDARTVSAALRAAATPWGRTRALLLPPSTVHAMTSAVGGWIDSAFDVVDRWSNRAGAAMRRALPGSSRV
jgi:transglutaminase-like putative cysteine protease